ncbi:sugar phosphate isomerase/epimerase family protein [Marinoscillum furvescens]|uniref:Secreted protein n=1 Tax=Marinoscillum furvescens DSM 4134 TaxID=1122208 RepID=A0A3D9L294_MARFU|nr:TIM barrel protein [Marinoscillum furvescens]RED95294.1 secreted protein [Marinoscillum furvescens DSM 4134]
MTTSRRDFVKKTGLMGLMAPFASAASGLWLQDESPLEVHLFSKHLQFLEVSQAAKIAAELGFSGLDLTVRPKGHVLPERVAQDLPDAIKAIREAGLKCELMTTAVGDASDPLDQSVVSVAAAHGVKYYRSNWFKYADNQPMEETLHHYQQKVAELSELNRKHKIIGCYQNHSGTSIGASIWEVKKLLEAAVPEYFGAQYDIRHAVVEGGRSWTNGLRLINDQIKTIVLKDFRWEQVAGRWQVINVPIGEGMVDFKKYFSLLKSYELKPPVSLHLEYPLGGAEKGRRQLTVDHTVVYEAMHRDLKKVQELWQSA